MKYYLAKMTYSIGNKTDFIWYSFIDKDRRNEIKRILTEAKINQVEISVGDGNTYNDSFTVDDLSIDYYDIPKCAVPLFRKLNSEDKAFGGNFWDIIYSFDEYLDIEDNEEDYENYLEIADDKNNKDI